MGLDSFALGALAGALRTKTGESFNITAVLDGEVSARQLARTMATKVKDSNTENGEDPLILSRPVTETSVAQGSTKAYERVLVDPIVS